MENVGIVIHRYVICLIYMNEYMRHPIVLLYYLNLYHSHHIYGILFILNFDDMDSLQLYHCEMLFHQ